MSHQQHRLPTGNNDDQEKSLKMLLSIFHVRIDINLAYYVCIVNLLRMGFRQNLTFS